MFDFTSLPSWFHCGLNRIGTVQDSAALATRIEGLEKDMEALKEANAAEIERLKTELSRTDEVRYMLQQH